MIAFLEGTLVAKADDFLVIQVGGVGLRVFAPAGLIVSSEVNSVVRVYTHLYVRESELSLYGFPSQEDVEVFRALIGVSGVGPRNALAILSAMSVEALRSAIGAEDVERLRGVPGIGHKTARKIILELKDRFGVAEGAPESLAALSEVDAQVIEALTSLGYSIVEAQRAVQSVPPDVLGVEERLRLALASLG